MRILFFAIFIIILSSCGDRSQEEGAAISSSIFGGELSSDEWSSVVSIQKNGNSYCTGTIIASDLVLTAAHCIRTLGFSLAKTTIVSDYATYTLESTATHPNYYGGAYDFGVMRIQGEFELEEISSISTEKPVPGDLLYLVGYGQDENEVKGVKRWVGTELSFLTNFELVAGGHGISSCHGDSGGPAFTMIAPGEYRIVGVTSRKYDSSLGCGQPTYYGQARLIFAWLQEFVP